MTVTSPRLPALLVGLGLLVTLVGCSAPTHDVVEAVSSMTSSPPPSSAVEEPRGLVDVAAVWGEHPLPPCDRVIVDNNLAAPPGVEMPSFESVAHELAGVKSPASDEWVRTKLGWVTQWLIQVRTAISTAADPLVGRASSHQFDKYINHTKQELENGHDIPDSAINARYPEGCK
ncbi:hypothetical protein H7J07_06740 [Mycobacterium koreense]|uniref:Uncharacterized protein n=1 Tax=Mycolicibacillus koreensis TaxID=1069220 RepID=A0A7I7SIT1_9MYCO|nr:hypothetical protein [Mycolicibacillus koreensis]MCV7247916.1 hypothetical protein [Mycolicibacillus koreensis]OSC23713.1 hypothetical protein B8W67_19800 [Mycolicibacillus koreensis]BBY56159.1 hypothetical protein MKOR_34100 [Mycolicibacillus koreensis]